MIHKPLKELFVNNKNLEKELEINQTVNLNVNSMIEP